MIEEGTAAFTAWVETPIPVYTKFYFFELISPRHLFHSHEKPVLEERGLILSGLWSRVSIKKHVIYLYREVEKKENLTWHENGTISYRRVKFWCG